MGFAVGHWLCHGWAGLLVAPLGALIAGTHNSWIGVLFGVMGGMILGSAGRPEVFGRPFDLFLLGALGGFLGSFLGDAWRFANIAEAPPVDQSYEPTHNTEDLPRRGG